MMKGSLGRVAEIRASAGGVRTAGRTSAPASWRHAVFCSEICRRLMRFSLLVRSPQQVFADPASFDIFSPNLALHMAFPFSQAPDGEAARAAAASAGRLPLERMTVARVRERTTERSETIRTLATRLERQFLRVERLVPREGRRGDAVAAPTRHDTPRDRLRVIDQASDMVVRRTLPAPGTPPAEAAMHHAATSSAPFGPPLQPTLPPREIDRVAGEVIATLNRQATAWRERMGRI